MTKRGKRRLLALAATVLLSATLFTVVRIVRDAQEQKIIAASRRDGLAAHAAGDFKTALAQLSYVFENDKEDLAVNMAFAAARAGLPLLDGRHLWEAVDLYSNHCLRLLNQEGASNIDPQGSQRRVVDEQLLDLYCQIGLTFEVVKTADRLLHVDPECVEALAAKTEALCLERDFDAAQPLAEKLIAIQPDKLQWRRTFLEIQNELGATSVQRIEQCRLWAKQYDQADGDGRFHVLTAAMLVDADRGDEARDELRLVADRGVQDKDVLASATGLFDLLEQREAADSLINSCIQEFPNQAWPFEVAVRRLWHANRVDEAAGLLKQARNALPTLDPNLRQLDVLIMIASRQLKEARAAATQYASVIPNGASQDEYRAWSSWMTAVATALDDRRSWRERIETLQQAVAASPLDSSLHSLLGDAWMEVGDTAHSVLSYQRAVAIDPNWVAAGMAYAEALLRAGRLEESYRASRIVLSRAAKDQVGPLFMMARSYLALRECGRIMDTASWEENAGEDLISLLQEMRQSDFPGPQQSQVAVLLADALFQIRGKEAGTEFLESFIQNEMVDAETLVALAEIGFHHLGTVHEPLLRRAEHMAGLTMPIAIGLAEAQAQRGNPAAGLQILEASIGSSSILDQVQKQMGCTAYMLRHHLQGGLESLKNLVDASPDSLLIQQLALGEPEIWTSGENSLGAHIAATALANVKKIIGEETTTARLAEAHALIRGIHRSDARDRDVAHAIRQVEFVLNQCPDSLAALSLMAEGSLLIEPLHSQHLDRAVHCLEHAAGLFPGESSVLVRLVKLLQQQGNYSQASRHLRVLAALSEKNADLHRLELRLWQNQGDFEAALVRAAAIVNDDSPISDQLILASILHRNGKVAEAEKIYNHLLQVSDYDSLTVMEAAEFFAATNRIDHGAELLQKMKQPDAVLGRHAMVADVALGAFYQRHRHFEKAGEHLRRAVHDHPNDLEARRELAWHCISQNDFVTAVEHGLFALQKDPSSQSVQSALASANLELGIDQRRKLLKNVVAIDESQPIDRVRWHENLRPLRATLTLLIDISLSVNGDYSPSQDDLSNARQLIDDAEPSNASRFLPAWQTAIRLNLDANRINEAAALAQMAVGRFPSHVEPARWATQILLSADQPQYREAFAEAQEWRRRALLAGSDTIAPDIAIASILLELKRPEDAMSQLARYAEMFWQQRQAHPDRLAVWVRASMHSHADALKDKSLQQQITTLFNEDHRWRQTWLDVASELDHQRAFDALAFLEPVTDQPLEQLALATQWTLLGKMSGNPACFVHAQRLAVEAGRDSAHAVASMVAQGVIAQSQKNWADAEEMYRKVLTTQPDDAVALNNLAFVLAQDSRRCDEALPLIQQALKLFPDHPDFLDTQARVLLGLSRAIEAKAVLQHAAKLRPNDFAIALALVEVQIQTDSGDQISQSLLDLQQRLRLEQRVDPEWQIRLDELWQRFHNQA